MMAHKRVAVERRYEHGMRGESARRCIGDIYRDMDVMGLTKGDFSMIDILAHLTSQVGECDVVVGTWTAGRADITQADRMLRDGNIKSMRMLVDRSFPNRQPEYFEKCCNRFGCDSIRLARFHAKFITIKGNGYNLVVRTSMNLNANKRIEMYEITDSAEMMGYFDAIVEHHFASPAEDSYEAFNALQIDETSVVSNGLANLKIPELKL